MYALKAIVNGAIYKDYGFLYDKALIFDAKIIDIIDISEVNAAQYDDVIDAKGHLILPGFIDVHHHGYGGNDTMDDSGTSITKISERLVENGVTAFLPTTMTMPTEQIKKSLSRIRQLMSQPSKGARILGAHLEGPFISSAYKGAQSDTYITKPNLELLRDYEGVVKLITLAPEVEGAMTFIKSISDTGITVSIGHTAADYSTVEEAYNNGARGITHLFSAMTGLHHRKPGCVGAALIKDYYCEVIADNIHMNPVMYELLLKTKKPEHILLITDCMRAGGMDDGNYELGGQKVTVTDGKCLLGDGTIAGSTLKLNKGLYNFITKTGLPLENAIRFITENPARYIGVYDQIGSLDNGKLADISIANNHLDVTYTIKKGEVVYEKKD